VFYSNDSSKIHRLWATGMV